MGAEIVQLVQQAGPYLTAALGAYGGTVLSRAEEAAADATADLGRRILRAVWSRGDESEQATLEVAVDEALQDAEDPDAMAALRQLIKRALRDDEELRRELAELLPAPSGTVVITASGTRSIAAQHIGTAVTGDDARVGE
ncbi:hypothetical protein OIB37_04830 [Streptomyces sp. NBC_00820]|uniref:hypothetical protein n=1 Tax=Streptomyces sp. NBC_00820 TaxID=2975842 RepID=UPI002ED02E74|nr:hypothetical protein OIB37_04830 [Streptomyces sp. NBC_00820]